MNVRSLSTALTVFIVLAALPASPVAAQKTKMDTPAIACQLPTGQVSIEILFSTPAAGTGAPAGFSLQWMTLDEFVANGDDWYLSSDPRLCKGSFSGNAFGHYYNVPAGSGTSVQIGDSIFDNPGASSNCASAPLVCGTDYVFRAFSHANSRLKRSDWTANLVCRTKSCDGVVGCTRTQGYWKTHGPSPTGNNSNEWPVTSLELGSVTYSDSELQSIFDTPARGNGLIALAHQLIAAKLNIETGASDDLVAATVSAADALIGALVVPPVGTGFLHPSGTSAHTATLTLFNEGGLGPKHCAD